jgi:hypothetical protein
VIDDLLLLLGIFAVLVNFVSSIAPRKYTHGSALRRNAWTIVPSVIAICVLLLTNSIWLVSVVTPTHTLELNADEAWRRDLAGCTVWSLTMQPKEDVEDLHIIFTFDREIYQSKTLKLRVGNVLDGQPVGHIGMPCNTDFEGAEPDNRIQFQVATNRHQLIIHGHNFNKYSAQKVYLTFYPDPGYGTKDIRIQGAGEVHYKVAGLRIPGSIKMVSDFSGRVGWTSDSSKHYISGVRGIMQRLVDSEASLIVNGLGILATILTAIVAWKPAYRRKRERSS